jgi:hypothetical protein
MGLGWNYDGTMEVMDGMEAIVVEDGGTDGMWGEVVRLGERVGVILCLLQPGVVAWSPPPRRALSEAYHLPQRISAMVAVVNLPIRIQICPVVV